MSADVLSGQFDEARAARIAAIRDLPIGSSGTVEPQDIPFLSAADFSGNLSAGRTGLESHKGARMGRYVRLRDRMGLPPTSTDRQTIDAYIDRLSDSVRDRGVVEPVSLATHGQSGLQVRDGHHRAIAAMEAGVSLPFVRIASYAEYQASRKAGR